MLELLILSVAFVAHAVWSHLDRKRIRRDLLKVAKNPRQARNMLLEDKSYKSLESK